MSTGRVHKKEVRYVCTEREHQLHHADRTVYASNDSQLLRRTALLALERGGPQLPQSTTVYKPYVADSLSRPHARSLAREWLSDVA